MPHLNGTGPDGQGNATGRGLGNCENQIDEEQLRRQLGIGMGKRRRVDGNECEGKGRRLKSGRFLK